MTRIDSRPSVSSHCTFAHASGEPPPEVLFERLLPRYERRFGKVPPVRGAAVEEVNRLMRHALARAARQPDRQRVRRD